MTQRVQIQCINKTNRFDPHDRIQNIGGVNPDRSRWKLNESQAIAYMEAGTYDFYVQQVYAVAEVIIATRLGKKYLKTVADGVSPDNLLSLPECPA